VQLQQAVVLLAHSQKIAPRVDFRDFQRKAQGFGCSMAALEWAADMCCKHNLHSTPMHLTKQAIQQ